MGDVNLEIKLNNLDERVTKIEDYEELHNMTVIDSGVTGWSPSIPPNSYVDIDIKFNKKFKTAPYVVVSYRGNSGNIGINISKLFALIIETTTNTAKIRLFNSDTDSRSIVINWIAVGK